MDPSSVETDNPSATPSWPPSDFNPLELIEDANDIVYTLDLSGRITFLNKAAERITGYSRQEVLGDNISDWLDRESRIRSDEMLRQKLGGVPRTTYEVTLTARDGRKLDLEVSTRLLFRHGVPAGIQGIARDITERKRAETLERDRNRVLQRVASNEPLEQVLGEICRLVERQLNGARCSIFLHRDDRLLLAAGPGMPKQAGPAEAVASTACFRRVPVAAAAGSPLGEFLLHYSERPPEETKAAAVMEAAVRLAVVAIEQNRLTETLAYRATHDPLTGLPNRSVFEKSLERALDESRRNSRPFAVLFIDLDRFKQINDSLGHLAGDQVLLEAARRLRRCLRRSDLVARMGGDEFTAVITDLSDSRDAVRVAEKLLSTFQDPFLWESQELFLSASIGISLFPRDGRDVATLLRNADVAMYRAKNRGRNTFELFAPELAAAARHRLEIENSLRRALEKQEFRLLYHPQADREGRLVAFEALLVWEHPKLGLIPPSEFIPVAEESGLIVPIGSWAIEQVCHQCAAWDSQGFPPVTVTVNISAPQFARRDFVDIVALALASANLNPTRLELELTESVILQRLEESASQMERLRALGVSIAVDDFGTGYSSLSYLPRLPLDVLKMDQSFLPAEGRQANALPLIEAIIALAHGLGLKVVAEGIESQAQFDTLKAAGCDRFQGYLWGEPLSSEGAARVLAEGLPPLGGRGAPSPDSGFVTLGEE